MSGSRSTGYTLIFVRYRGSGFAVSKGDKREFKTITEARRFAYRIMAMNGNKAVGRFYGTIFDNRAGFIAGEIDSDNKGNRYWKVAGGPKYVLRSDGTLGTKII